MASRRSRRARQVCRRHRRGRGRAGPVRAGKPEAVSIRPCPRAPARPEGPVPDEREAALLSTRREAWFSTRTLARISTVVRQPERRVDHAAAASLARPLPHVSGVSAKPSASRSEPRDSRLIEPIASRLPADRRQDERQVAAEALASRAA